MRRALPCLFLLAAGCASGPSSRSASRGADTSASVGEVPVQGFQVTVKPTQASRESTEGELLAVDEEHVWISSLAGPVGYHRTVVDSVVVQLESTAVAWGLGGWTLAGVASTLTHGFFFFLTAPVWTLVGSVTAVVTDGATRTRFLHGRLGELYQFARYPQGLPPQLWRCQVHPPAPHPTQAPPPTPL